METKTKHGKLFVVSGSSGAGKTTLVIQILKDIGKSAHLERVVTFTTRLPREGDIPGHDYCFVTHERFKQLIKDDFFLEWSTAYGNYYGTPSTIIDTLALGTSLIIIVDRLGVHSIARKIVNAVFIWIDVPSIDLLRERLLQRNTEAKIEIDKRIELAKNEIILEKENSLYNYRLINDVFSKTLQNLEDIIQEELK